MEIPMEKENETFYSISSSISWELHDNLRDLSLYSDDILPAILNKKVEDAKQGKDKPTEKSSCDKDETTKIVPGDFYCKECDKNFRNRYVLTIHERIHTGKKPFVCDICGRAYAAANNLSFHLKIVHKKVVSMRLSHYCKHCDKYFNGNSTLKIHMRSHTGEKPFVCDVCGYSFASPHNLKRHKDYKHNKNIKKKFKCETCERCFVFKSDLKNHMKSHMERERNFECQICHKSFLSNNHLKRHLQIHDENRELFKCDQCGKGFCSPTSLSEHQRVVHNGEKSFKCQICQLAFSFKGNLKRHLNTHGTKVKIKCGTCGELVSDLYRHKEIHNAEKSFQCELCGHKSRRREHLKKHMRTHTGEKPFKCNICEKMFSDDSACRSHTRKLHGKKTNSKK